MKRMLLVAALAASSSLASAQAVTVTLTEWKVALSRDTVKAGPVTFRVSNAGSMSHGLYVRGAGVEKGTRDLAKGESATLTVTVKPGTYEVFCPMSDGSHKVAGMTHQLVVTAADAAPAKKKPAD
jgi:plastocyanin